MKPDQKELLSFVNQVKNCSTILNLLPWLSIHMLDMIQCGYEQTLVHHVNLYGQSTYI